MRGTSESDDAMSSSDEDEERSAAAGFLAAGSSEIAGWLDRRCRSEATKSETSQRGKHGTPWRIRRDVINQLVASCCAEDGVDLRPRAQFIAAGLLHGDGQALSHLSELHAVGIELVDGQGIAATFRHRLSQDSRLLADAAGVVGVVLATAGCGAPPPTAGLVEQIASQLNGDAAETQAVLVVDLLHVLATQDAGCELFVFRGGEARGGAGFLVADG